MQQVKQQPQLASKVDESLPDITVYVTYDCPIYISTVNLANLLHGHQNAHTSLKCLAARSIATNRLNFRGMIPTQLEAFIQMHSVHKVLT